MASKAKQDDQVQEQEEGTGTEFGRVDKYLDSNNSAECPIEGFSGAITFPAVMSLPLYQKYVTIMRDASDDDDQNLLVFITKANDERAVDAFSMTFAKMAPHFALEMPKRIIKNRKGVAEEVSVDFSDESKIPWQFQAWLSLTTREWVTAQLSFRLP